MSYLQPIETIVGMMNSYYEDGILKSVQNVGFNVNKEELEKALLYDRGQYEKGYSDGKVETIDEVLEIITETEKYEKKLTTPMTTPVAFGFRLAVEQIKREVELLKGGE